MCEKPFLIFMTHDHNAGFNFYFLVDDPWDHGIRQLPASSFQSIAHLSAKARTPRPKEPKELVEATFLGIHGRLAEAWIGYPVVN